jgi:hypothetical protein
MGKWASVKRVARRVLLTTDFSSITNDTNNQRVSINHSTILSKTGVATNIDGKAIILGFEREVVLSDRDLISSRYAHNYGVVTIDLILPSGTYATLAEARTALAGTVIYYELATPITLTESQFAENGIAVDGVLTSNNDFTEFVVDSDIFSPLIVTYATNLAKSVENLKESTQGIRDVLPSKANKVQEDWIEPTLLNGWVSQNGYPVRYMIDEFGFVHMEGALTGGSVGTIVFKLPDGYKTNQTSIKCNVAGSGTSNAVIQVSQNGDFTVSAMTGTFCYINELMFRAV